MARPVSPYPSFTYVLATASNEDVFPELKLDASPLPSLASPYNDDGTVALCYLRRRKLVTDYCQNITIGHDWVMKRKRIDPRRLSTYTASFVTPDDIEDSEFVIVNDVDGCKSFNGEAIIQSNERKKSFSSARICLSIRRKLLVLYNMIVFCRSESLAKAHSAKIPR